MDDACMDQKKDEPKRRETQQERLMRKWRQKLYQPKPEASRMPTGGPTQGAQ